MTLNILKRDLKRKKAMNIILFIFAILAAMFVASGISIVTKVLNGTDYFLDKAGAGDFVIISQNRGTHINETLESSKAIDSYKTDEIYYIDKDNIKNGDKEAKIDNIPMFQSDKSKGIKFFKDDGSVLDKVDKGQVYITKGFLKDNDLKVGDSIEVDFGKTKKKFKIAGEFKDAIFGSSLLSNKRFIFNDEDYKVFDKDDSVKAYKGFISYIKSDKIDELEKDLSKANNILFNGSRSIIKLSFVMEMMIALVVLVLSICLIIVSFVILKFVITFTVGQEYQQIGVMKAIGIKNRKIRKLYIIKYFFIALIGGLIGLAASFPLENMILKGVTEKMMLGNEFGIMANIFGALLVIFLMVLFAYLCTRKVNKYSPVDAIRNGQTGERYKKKTILRIKNVAGGNPLYLAINDILSAPRKFVSVIITFFLCSVFVFGMVVCTDTMKSGNLIDTLAKKSDAYINDSKFVKMSFMSEDGEKQVEKFFKDLEDRFKKEKMPARVSMDVLYKYKVSYKDKDFSISCYQNKWAKMSEYPFYKGSAPRNDSEIAITPIIADKFGIDIGDTVTIDFVTEKKDCMVVGIFQSMNNVGETIRIHEDAPTNMKYASSMMAVLIDYKDNPDKKEIDRRAERIKEIYGVKNVYNSEEYCKDCIKVVDTMDMVSKSLMLIVIIIVVLITILMEKAFITDEKGQIALLKAIGFANKSIIKWHVYRFTIVSLITEILAIALSKPITKLWCDRIWDSMGATNVDYVINPLTVMLIYPGIILLVNVITTLITALSIRRIKSNDMANVE